MRKEKNLTNTTAWQVFLGCSTAKRLANEVNIPRKTAHKRLERAYRNGVLLKSYRGNYSVTAEFQSKYTVS